MDFAPFYSQNGRRTTPQKFQDVAAALKNGMSQFLCNFYWLSLFSCTLDLSIMWAATTKVNTIIIAPAPHAIDIIAAFVAYQSVEEEDEEEEEVESA